MSDDQLRDQARPLPTVPPLPAPPAPATPAAPSILDRAGQILADQAAGPHVTGGLILQDGDLGAGASVKTGTKGGWSAAAVWQWTKQQGHAVAAMVGWRGKGA